MSLIFLQGRTISDEMTCLLVVQAGLRGESRMRQPGTTQLHWLIDRARGENTRRRERDRRNEMGGVLPALLPLVVVGLDGEVSKCVQVCRLHPNSESIRHLAPNETH